MTPLRWGIIVFLCGITLLGLPIGAESEVPTEEIKPSSAKECRAHIEKALEQYWDQKEPSDKNSVVEQNRIDQDDEDDENEHTNKSKLDDESEEDDDESEEDQDDDEEDEDLNEDDDDDEEETDDENDDNKNVSEADDEEEDDDEEDDDEEDDDEDDTEQNDKESNRYPSLESDAEEEDTSEDATTKLDKPSGEKIVNDEDDESDEDDEDDENDEDDEEDEDDGDNDDEKEEDSTKTELKSKENDKKESIKNNANGNNGKAVEEDDEDEEEEEEEDEEDEDEEEGDEKGEEEDEEDDDEDESEVDENEETNKGGLTSNYTKSGEHSQKDLSPEEIKIEIQIENDKVTGEADRASGRVATEFLHEKPSFEQPQATEVEEKNLKVTVQDVKRGIDSNDDHEKEDEPGTETTAEKDNNDDDSIENIYEDDDDVDSTSGVTFRSRDHIDVILGLDEIGTEYDKDEEKLAQTIFKDIKKILQQQIKPMEMLYKYTDSTSRVLGDAEIFNKPMLLFLGPWSAGKTSIINYLLGTERTPAALKTGTGITDVDFTLITYGDQKRVISGTELAADWRYAGVQKFGQGFLDHFRSVQIPHTLLKRITIVDSPGILENRKNADRGYSLNDAFQWFVDRSDAIYVVLDPTKVDIGSEVGSVIDQLKGRDARFILNKADTIRRSDLMRVVGQLFWNLSPLMSSTEAPVIYAVSLTTKPYHSSAPAKFLADQEKNFLYDMKDTLEKRVENRILYARRHAVRVRNHAKMVDCYLATYYRHKSIFSSKRNVAKLITENPREYNIFDGLGGMTNVSRYDLPDPTAYKEFFKLHPLYDFKPLASTCSYFRGCPMDKLDLAISKDIPELLAKYKKIKQADSPQHEGR